MGGGRGVEVINSKGCSRLFVDSIPNSMNFRVGLQMSPASASASSFSSQRILPSSNAPFYGLVIFVTGLSKEARKQVRDATERLGGQYSPHLHPQCTHLVVQSSHGRKFEHALKHGRKNGLFIVTLGWFVDSVRRNVRLSESLYSVKSIGQNEIPKDTLNELFHYPSMENSGLPMGMLEHFKQSDMIERPHSLSSEKAFRRSMDSTLSGHSFYVDTDVSSDLHRKDRNGDNHSHDHELSSGIKVNLEERQKIANLAKNGAGKRRDRPMQRCQTPIRPITPNSLLDSICWSISEPTSSASIYTESSGVEDSREHHTAAFFDANGPGKEAHASFVNCSRKLTDSEEIAVIFKNHFLTILFPVDRFAEMGPCSRTFFSDTGFTCLQVLNYIHAFYQENMSNEEIEVAIHTDSCHADRLRSMYSSKETADRDLLEFKRVEFLGSRRSFEMLKRVTGDNVYELLIRA